MTGLDQMTMAFEGAIRVERDDSAIETYWAKLEASVGVCQQVLAEDAPEVESPYSWVMFD